MRTQDTFDQQLRPMQVIVAAMLAGGVVTLVIFAFLQPPRAVGQAPASHFVTYFGLAFAAVASLVSFALPRLTIATYRKQIVKQRMSDSPAIPPRDDTTGLLNAYKLALIQGAALLEGPTFFLLIAYYLEAQIISLIAAGVMLGLLAARLPTRARLRAWLDTQLGLLEQDRRAGA